MKTIKLMVTALDPLVITDGTTEGMSHETLDYIPGNMLLGAFAGKWRRNHPEITGKADGNSEFQELFLGSTEWGHAYPADDEWNQSVPVPLSFQKIKGYEGIPCSTESTENVFVVNMLSSERKQDEITNLLNEELKKSGNPGEVKESKLKKLSTKFMFDRETRLEAPSVRKCWNMHVALGTKRSAIDSQLFGYSSIAPGTKFISEIFCSNEASSALEKLLGKEGEIRVGHSRSAGYGKAAYTAEFVEGRISTSISESDGCNLDVLLTSDFMPKHSWEKPIESLEKELENELGLPEGTIKNASYEDKRAFSANIVIAGFNSQWNLPRTTRQALPKGSAFRWKLKTPINAEARRSIGSYTHEGYGRILINPPFLKNLKAMVDLKGVYKGKKTEIKKTFEFASGIPAVMNPIRARAIKRLADENSLEFVMSDRFSGFFTGASKGSKLSHSQMNNIRFMISSNPSTEWCKIFAHTLEKKTTLVLWQDTRTFNPFAGYRDTMNEIMPHLLCQEKLINLASEVLEKSKMSELELPGGRASQFEANQYRELFHKAAMLHIVSRWDKASRR